MRKADTLVEVVVGLFIFTLVMTTSIMLYTSMTAFHSADHAYLIFEAKCQDINFYYDHYGNEWETKYFGKKNDGGKYYYNSSFNLINNVEKASYVIVVNEGMSLSIKKVNEGVEEEKYIIKDLEYGASKYCSLINSYKATLISEASSNGVGYYNKNFVKMDVLNESIELFKIDLVESKYVISYLEDGCVKGVVYEK